MSVNDGSNGKTGSRLLNGKQLESLLAVATLSRPGIRETTKTPPPATVHLCSEHPLVLQAIESALQADPDLQFPVRSVGPAPEYFDSDKGLGVAIVDIDSVADLKELLLRAVACGIRPIAVISHSTVGSAEQARLLNRGVWGIVPVSPSFGRDLARAIRAVVAGDLWVNPEILQDYVKQTHALLARLPESHLLTAREEQVINFLIRNLSNKQIAAFLGISERTVKFHVSNILQKANVETRRDLLQLTDTQSFMAGG